MPTLTATLSDVPHASVLESVPGRYASLDWFVERTLLDKVSAVRTEEAAPSWGAEPFLQVESRPPQLRMGGHGRMSRG